MPAHNHPYPIHGHMVELLIVEYVRDHQTATNPVTLQELHKRLSTAFFDDDVRVVIDKMLSDGRLVVEFDHVNVLDRGLHWTPGGRPAVRLKVEGVRR